MNTTKPIMLATPLSSGSGVYNLKSYADFGVGTVTNMSLGSQICSSGATSRIHGHQRTRQMEANQIYMQAKEELIPEPKLSQR